MKISLLGIASLTAHPVTLQGVICGSGKSFWKSLIKIFIVDYILDLAICL